MIKFNNFLERIDEMCLIPKQHDIMLPPGGADNEISNYITQLKNEIGKLIEEIPFINCSVRFDNVHAVLSKLPIDFFGGRSNILVTNGKSKITFVFQKRKLTILDEYDNETNVKDVFLKLKVIKNKDLIQSIQDKIELISIYLLYSWIQACRGFQYYTCDEVLN